MESKADKNIGKVVGNYKIISYLGKGQFGKVYKARNSEKVYAAIKIIKKKKINKIEKLKELLNTEILVMKKIEHPNIMKLYNYYESDNNYYLAIEYCEKGDLLQYLEKQDKNFVKEEEAIFFLKQIAIGFQELKKNKIMHRDLKWENIFLKNNKIIIGDFGFSKFGDIGITNLGSPITMAPEILNKSSVYTDKADLWSIGVIFYQLLFGEYPFIGKNKKYILNDIKNKISNLEFKEDLQKISKHSKDLLNNIFKIDVNERISWDEFFNHKLFKLKNNYSQIYRNKKFGLKSELRNETNDNFNQLRNNILTKNLKDKNNELDDKNIEFGIDKNDIIKLNSSIYDNYLNMVIFFNKGIETMKKLNSKNNLSITNKINIVIILIYEKSKIILSNIFKNIELKLNIFYINFFEDFIETEGYSKLLGKFSNYSKKYEDLVKNYKNNIKLSNNELNEISFLNSDGENDVILNQIDEKLAFQLKELHDVRNKLFIETKNPEFVKNYYQCLLFIYYTIQSEYYFKHFKKSLLFNWDNFYNKFLSKDECNIDKKIDEL